MRIVRFTTPESAMVVMLVVFMGCGQSSTVPPVGLSKPPATAIATKKAAHPSIKSVVATISIPRNNLKKSDLTGDKKKDAELCRKLRTLNCVIEFTTSKDLASKQLDFGVSISARHGKHRFVHCSGGGAAVRTEEGKYICKLDLAQSLPLELDSDATINVTIVGLEGYVSASGMSMSSFGDGKVIIKQDE